VARRRGRARGSVGGITKTAQLEVEGFDQLVKNLRRISDQARVQILEGAVNQGAEETLALMEQLAPLSPGAGSRGYHSADRLVNLKQFSKRDSRARNVGVGRGADGAWALKFAEHGTVFHPETPFIKPTAQAMRKRMIQIIIAHWRKVVQKGIK